MKIHRQAIKSPPDRSSTTAPRSGGGFKRAIPLKADHILIALSALIVTLIAARLELTETRPAATVISRECELFYGPIGADAVRLCQDEMTALHLPPKTLKQRL